MSPDIPIPSTKIVAIHQPNFFPWLGYFDKIRRADLFVLLDDVQIQKTGSSWVNRVKLNLNNEARWITCPILRTEGVHSIHEVNIDDRQPWRDKLLKSIEQNYRKAPNFEALRPTIEGWIRQETDNLADFNITIIQEVMHLLGLTTPLIRHKDLNTSLHSTSMLVEILKATGGTTYLCGGGADGYQEDHLFSEAGITLEYQGFKPTPYGNPGTYLAGLSVLDFLLQAETPDYAKEFETLCRQAQAPIAAL